MTEFEWKEVTRKAARAAAEENLKSFKKMNKGSSKLMTDEEMVSKWADDYIGRLRREYPYETFSEKTAFEIENFPASDLNDWFQSGQKNPKYPSPTQHAKNVEASKFLPLLAGAAEPGNDWYSMGSTMLKREGDKLGYDVSTKEGFSEFLGKLGEYQKEFDLAKNAEELRQLRPGIPGTDIELGPKGWAYILGSLVYPTATKAIDNAVATGEDLSAGKVAALSALDFGINAGMWRAPSLNIMKASPVLNGLIDAGIQGGLEGVRQGVGGAAGVETDYASAPLAAIAAGATRPAMLGTVQGMLGQAQGKSAREFARGFSRATRAGNPVETERAQLSNAIDYYNKQWKKMMENDAVRRNWESQGNFNIWANLPDKKRLLEANMPAELSEFAKIARKSDGTLDKEMLLKYYDGIYPRISMNFKKEGFSSVNEKAPLGWHYQEPTLSPKKSLSYYMGGEDVNTLARLVPSKIAELEDRTPWGTAGLVIGHALGRVGGSLEPIIKINPLKPRFDTNYKNTSWYSKLNREQREIVDTLFKKKAEEGLE